MTRKNDKWRESGSDSPFGFTWEQMAVERLASIKRHDKDPFSDKVIRVNTDYHQLEIYVSPTGRSVRVWKDHKEIK